MRALDALFEGTNLAIRSGISRISGKPKSVFESADYVEGAAAILPAQLHLVRLYHHPTCHDVYSGWLSGTWEEPLGVGLYDNLFVQPVEGRWLVVARYHVCGSCRGAGKIKRKKCTECDIAGWEHRGGHRFRTLGKLIETQKLTPPTNANYLPAYEAA